MQYSANSWNSKATGGVPMYLVEGEKATSMQQLLRLVEEKAVEVNDPNYVPRNEDNLDIF